MPRSFSCCLSASSPSNGFVSGGIFWDLFGEQGHPIRTTASEMGPLLLARLMDLNEVQEGVLTIAFPMDQASRILSRLPPPTRKGTTKHSAARTNGRTSGTYPVSSIR